MIGIIEGKEFQNAEQVKSEIAKLKSEIDGLRPFIEGLGPEESSLKTKFNDLVDKHAELGNEHHRLAKVLALSFDDKAKLSRKLEEVDRERTRLSIQNAQLQQRIEEQVRSLRVEATQWDIRRHGLTHNLEIFQKEISTLSIDKLKQKIDTLQQQVEAKYPRGRRSVSGFSVLGGMAKERQGAFRPELFKVG
jgi:chromosome segregation ATPase